LANLAAATVPGLVAHAQQETAQTADDPRYTVELIVFTYAAAEAGSNEIFVPDRPKLVPDAEEEMPADVSQNAFGDIPDELPVDVAAAEAAAQDGQVHVRERIELELLGPDAYTMNGIYGKLERLDAYQPIMRAAWTQTTPPRDASPAVHLRALEGAPPGLDGSVTLYRGRYLHLVVDLALDADSGSGAALATDRLVTYGDDRVRDDDRAAGLDSAMNHPVRYRIYEDRIMKTGDLRYFDHPRFGIIARVTRPDVNPDSPATTEDVIGGGTD
jgi:hypothetical protein